MTLFRIALGSNPARTPLAASGGTGAPEPTGLVGVIAGQLQESPTFVVDFCALDTNYDGTSDSICLRAIASSYDEYCLRRRTCAPSWIACAQVPEASLIYDRHPPALEKPAGTQFTTLEIDQPPRQQPASHHAVAFITAAC